MAAFKMLDFEPKTEVELGVCDCPACACAGPIISQSGEGAETTATRATTRGQQAGRLNDADKQARRLRYDGGAPAGWPAN